MEGNAQLQLALDFIQYTDRNVFLTGKAGTGKTTFLHQLKKHSPKRMAIVAPTGVAAINAGGVTIHSFFQMPFGPFVPAEHSGRQVGNNRQQYNKRFNKEKINLIRSLDLLVIDEISMVRADTLDGIDETLRHYKDPSKPFGGIQLLMIGDLHQLSPVVKDEDWQILRHFYSDLYFFSSRAYRQSAPVCIELTHIYRQSDTRFIGLLNAIREGKADRSVLDALNERYIPGFKSDDHDGYITLTTHNYSANETNRRKLAEINKKAYRFTAGVNDDFPEYAYPTDVDLELKEGAQVMFVKNDSSRDHLFYNGKIGRVEKIDGDTVYVRCQGDTSTIEVKPAEWQNMKYELNPATKEVEEKVIGTFIQHPLKLAWAITIHKSQGLTFEHAVIDAGAAFAHGQVYVALSRCKSFEGMVLSSPISFSSIKTDRTVAEFTKNANGDMPCEQHLEPSKTAFQQSLLLELVDFNEVKTSFFRCKKVAEDHDRIIAPGITDTLIGMKDPAETKIYAVADAFKRQLGQLMQQNRLPEQNEALQERVRKAAAYFSEQVETVIYSSLQKCVVETDNKAVKKTVSEALQRLKKDVFVKLAVMRSCLNGFNTLEYVRIRANAEIDFASARMIQPVAAKAITTDVNIPHAALYAQIRKWRNELAAENNVPVYIVLPQKTLLELVTHLPSSLTDLEKIKGLGKTKIQHYGKEILSMIQAYCESKGIERVVDHGLVPVSAEPEKKEKVHTREISFRLFREGRSVTEIAAERGFTVSTIEGHLGHFVGTGELNVYEVVAKEKADRIAAYLQTESPGSLSEAKVGLGDDVSFGELKAVMKHLEFLEASVSEVPE